LTAADGTGLVGIGTAKRIGCLARRNAVKRRARNVLIQHPQWLDPHHDYILILGASAGEAEYSALTTELETLFVKMSDRWANN
jgi:ribonuclease P protein component